MTLTRRHSIQGVLLAAGLEAYAIGANPHDQGLTFLMGILFGLSVGISCGALMDHWTRRHPNEPTGEAEDPPICMQRKL